MGSFDLDHDIRLAATQNIGGWQASGILRRGDTNKQVELQANFRHAPGVYTVEFAVVPPATGAGVYSALADISWRVEGGEVKRTVSIGSGVAVTGVGQGVRVLMRDESPGGALPAADYTVFCQVSPGSRGNTSQPPTLRGQIAAGTFGIGAVAAGAAGPPGGVAIPQGIGVISVQTYVSMQNGGATAIASLQKVIITHNNAADVLKMYQAVLAPGFVPIAPNTTTISFDNTRAAAGDDITIALAWGIEG